MREKEIAEIAAILARWNPLGDAAAGVRTWRAIELRQLTSLVTSGCSVAPLRSKQS